MNVLTFGSLLYGEIIYVDITNTGSFEEANMQDQKTQTFRGAIQTVKNVNTRSGRKMITFGVGAYPFKAFGEQAEAVERLEGEHVEITAKHNTFHGKDEYAVVTIASEIDGQRVNASGIPRSTPALSSQAPVPVPPQNLKHAGRSHWDLRSYGSNLQARKVGAWLNEFFDSLTEEEWRQWQMPKYQRSGTFPITEEEAETQRTWRDTSTPPPRPAQDLEGVKTRFNARLDLVREDLGHKATAQVSRTGFTAIDDSAPNYPQAPECP